MATDQVLNWIGGATTIEGQPSVRLSKTIESFETDFSNGYLFGEILTQYGILESINTFSKKSNKEAKVHNFYQIEDALRYLKVPFDAKLSHQIMNEERGATLRLLYQLKIALERHLAKGDLTVTNLKQKVVDNKVKKVADLAISLPKIHTQYGVEEPTFKFKHKPLKYVEEKLLKYEVARANLEKQAHEDELAETNMLKSIQQSKRQENIKNLKENQQFMKEWMTEGKKNWKINRETRAKEMARQLYFDDREVMIYKQNLSKTMKYHDLDLQNGIEAFHENMQKLGIEQNISIQEAIQKQEEKKGIPPGQIQNFSYAATMNKIKETKNNNEFAGKERERRIRKMHVDQRNIQETLDAKKYEEDLIKRLLETQSSEKDTAYLRWRAAKCRKMVVDNKRGKAFKSDMVREVRNKQIDNEMKATAEQAEIQRAKEKEENEAKMKQIRKEKKAKKRHINIEIASELIDLIMDVADEAFDFQEQRTGQLLDKPTWRKWMDIFSDGKKVSEQNIVINEDDVPKNKDSMAMLMGSISPQKLLIDVKSDPVYEDFLQYITMSGPLNLRLVAPSKWHSLLNVAQKDQNVWNQDLQFLNEFYIPSNKELGQYIDKLYSPTMDDVFKTSHTTIRNEQTFKPSFPAFHPVKICIQGKAFSGKKTQAKKVIEKLGADKFTLFDMQEIVREALILVDPNANKEEAVDPKAKGKAPPKTPMESTPQADNDPDMTAFKDIASLLLQQVQLVTGDTEKLPGKNVDLLSLIEDDHLLAQLFCQKLKIVYKDAEKVGNKNSVIRDKIAKEKQLLEQLEEAKAAESTEVDPKAKGKKAASKSPQEIEEEITQLLKPDINGWVLIDFPRNIHQAKILENMFTGYELMTDKSKPEKIMNFETWSKFSDPYTSTSENYEFEIETQNSLFDIFFVLDTSKEECMRRAKNRKLDPASGSIYHMEDHPPPDDPKVVEKLTQYYGFFTSEDDMIQKLDSNHIRDSEAESSLKQFVNIFGKFDAPSKKGFKTCVEVKIDGQVDQEKSFKNIDKAIEELLKFKQIAEDRRYAELKQQIIMEELEKEAAEAAAAAAAKAAEESKAADGQTSPQQEPEDFKEQMSPIPISSPSPLKADHLASKTSLVSHPVLSHSKLSQGGITSKRQKKVEYTREYKIKIWEDMQVSYIRDGMMALGEIKKQNETVVDSLNNCQRQFIQFLERPCQKQEKIDEFVSSFNKFTEEFPDLRKDDQTKEELLNRLELLSNSLWHIIETRKDESIDQIKKMSEVGWSDIEMRNLCRNMASLIEIEIKKFETVYQLQMMAEPPIALDAEIFVKKLLDRGTKPYDGQSQTSPIFEALISNLLLKLDDVVNRNTVVMQVKDDHQGMILKQEMKIFIYRLSLINSWALVLMDNIYINSRKVYDQLDDWIVVAVAQENEITQNVLKVIKEAIQTEQQKFEDYEITLPTLSLLQHIQTSHYSGQEVLPYLRNVHIPSDNIESTRFNIDHLVDLHCQIRFNTPLDALDTQTFQNMMLLAFRQGRIPLVWKYMSFDKILQLGTKFALIPMKGPDLQDNESPKMYSSKTGLNINQSNRNWISWKKVFLHFALLNSSMPSEKDLANLRVKLSEAGENQHVNKEEFKQTPFWFDSFEGKPDTATLNNWIAMKAARALEDQSEDDSEDEYTLSQQLDQVRLSSLKELLFDVFRVNTGEELLYVPNLINFLIETTRGAKQTFADSLF